MHPFNSIPELAGIATYADAARVGWSVDENVRRLMRLQWTERRLMRVMIARLTREPGWEVKCALALHQWQCALRIDALRERIAEMRHPLPRLDVSPEGAADIDGVYDELESMSDTRAIVAGLYVVALPALQAAYRQHLERCN